MGEFANLYDRIPQACPALQIGTPNLAYRPFPLAKCICEEYEFKGSNAFPLCVMSGLLSSAEDKWNLNGVQSGSLGSSYFISIMIVAPLVAGAIVGRSGRIQMYGIS